MKKLRWVLLIVAIVLALPIANLVAAPNTSGTLKVAGGGADWAKAAKVLEGKCVHCHAAASPKPFYAGLPVARGMIEGDVLLGTAALDMSVELQRREIKPSLSEAALAKLEWALDKGEMPPGKYLLLHWNHRLSDGDVAALRGWIGAARRAHFGAEDVAKAHAGGPLQPLPSVESLKLDPKKVALGDKLFHDKRLSKDSTLSCASCHGLDKGGTDQVAVSVGVGGKKGPINSPTVYNAGLQVKQFWDGRADDLFEQADGPVNNPIEMAANWKMVIERLKQDEALMAEIAAVYPDGVNDKNIRDAIATFEKSLVTPGPLDAYLRGEDKALNDAQTAGLKTFTAKGCVTCHVGKVLGGQSFEKMGLHKPYFAEGKVADVDLGRFNVSKKPRDKHRFKVPMLRNIALTQPYFHDASAKTLEQAVQKMVEHQLEHPLSTAELKSVVTFLEALTGSYKGKPLASAK